MTPLAAFSLFLLPAAMVAVAFAALAVVSRPGRVHTSEEPRRGPGLLGRLAGRLAPPALFGLAFWPADIALHQWHPLWPVDGSNRFLGIAIAAAVGAAAHAAVGTWWLAIVVRLVLGAAVTYGVLSPLPEQYVARPLLAVLCIVAALWLAGAGAVLDRAQLRTPRFALLGGLALAVLAAAPGLFESGYASGAQLAGALGSMAGGGAIALLLFRRAAPELAGAHTVWLALLGAVLLVTYGYQDVPAWWALALMAIAPFGAIAGHFSGRMWVRAAAAITVPALIAGGATLAVILAAVGGAEEASHGY
jgi:hypothetical protein